MRATGNLRRIAAPLLRFLGNRSRAKRRARVFSIVDSRLPGLEIGPCDNGIAPKREGYQVRILDHLDQEGLRAKYADHPQVDISKIEVVDHVWGGEPYAGLLGGARVDWIIASHVVEHVPDLVGFLLECASILGPGGRLILFVPDHRRVFDCRRSPSGTGEIVDAHLQRRKAPSPGEVAEHHLRVATKGNRLAWPLLWPGRVRSIHTDQEVREAFEAAKVGEYRDVHVWKFTPDSFGRIADDLRRLDLIDLQVERIESSHGSEFFVAMRRPA